MRLWQGTRAATRSLVASAGIIAALAGPRCLAQPVQPWTAADALMIRKFNFEVRS